MDPRVVDLETQTNEVCKWTGDDCFRHFYVHWRNGIRLSNDNPNLELKETQDHITVLDPDNDSGFIRLERSSGMLVLHGAAMPSGQHLDSLRKATLGMILNGHHVNYHGRETWEFYRRGDNLSARVTQQYQDENEDPAQAALTALEIFNVESESLLSWLGITLDICNMSQPRSVMEGEVGDMILDPEYADRVFVDGVQVSSRHLGLFQFGYHYRAYDGLVTADLDLDAEDVEAQLRCQVWMEAAMEDSSLISLMFNIMRARPWLPDVRRFEDHLDAGTVEMMRDCMIEECQKYLFCCEMDDVKTISKRTSRPILVLPLFLWNLFYHQNLIRNGAEELIYTAKPVEPPSTPFSFNVQRIIRALLLTDRDTNRALLTFVDVPLASPSVYYHSESRTIYASRFWLDYTVVHRIHPCRVSDLRLENASFAPFRCDHAVLALYANIMHAAAKPLAGSEIVSVWVARKCQSASQRLEERPVLVSMQRAYLSQGDVCVQWQRAVPACMDDLVDFAYYVVMHRQRCVFWASQFAHYINDKRLQVIFKLPPGENYIPMVALKKPGTLYSVPPTPPTVPERMANTPPGQNLIHSLRESWQKEKFPLLFTQFTPPYGSGLAPGRNPQFNPAAVGHSSRLNFRFERHQYISVRYDEYHPAGPQTTSYVLYVYGIQPGTSVDDEGSLVVTVYSFLRTTELWQFQTGLAGEQSVGLRELLLHYWNFENMGTRQDAVVLPINKIIAVQPVASALLGSFESIVHTVNLPDPARTPYYCRFAVRCGSAPSNSACVMPVASHLLSHSKRWPEPRYGLRPWPSVIDLSPAFLGLAEGFSQAGCRIDAAFAFDPANHYTWKARYPDAKLYDGPLSSIVSDLVAKTLTPPESPRDNPLILLLTIPDRNNNTWDPAREFHLLHVLPALITVLKKPDMVVIALPPWVLVEQAFRMFFPVVYALLQERYAVHLKRVPLARFGPVSGEMLFLVASCVPAPIPWDVVSNGAVPGPGPGPGPGPSGQETVFSRIHDLNFLNSRAFTHSSGSSESLVCTHPVSNAEVYNHPAGLAGTPSVTLDLNMQMTLDSLKRGVKHYERSDVLTVRELARVQSFPDDFVFLGGRAKQYADVLSGVQPVIARDVATRVMMVFREFIAPKPVPVPASASASCVMPASRAMPAPRAMPASKTGAPASGVPATSGTPAPSARVMPESGSFSAPASAAPGSVSFSASGSGSMPPSGSTPGSAVSESTIPGSAASGSAMPCPSAPVSGSSAPGMAVFRFRPGVSSGSGGSGSGMGSSSGAMPTSTSASDAMPASAPPGTVSFSTSGAGALTSDAPMPEAPIFRSSTSGSVAPGSGSMCQFDSGAMPASSTMPVRMSAPSRAVSLPTGPGGMSGSSVSGSGAMPASGMGSGSDAMPMSAPAGRVSFPSGPGAIPASSAAPTSGSNVGVPGSTFHITPAEFLSAVSSTPHGPDFFSTSGSGVGVSGSTMPGSTVPGPGSIYQFGSGVDSTSGGMSAPASAAPGSTFFPFMPMPMSVQGSGSDVMAASDSVMSGALGSSSAAPGSAPGSVSASCTDSGLSSAFRPSVSLSRPFDFDVMPCFNSPGAGLAPMADPLASMSAHLEVPSLPPSVEAELDTDFDMEEFLDEFLDNDNDNDNDEEERGRKRVRS